MTGKFLEDGDDSGDEAAFSIAAIKAKYKTGGGKDKKPIYSSDEDDDSDVENKKGKRLQKAKGVDSDSDSNRLVLFMKSYFSTILLKGPAPRPAPSPDHPPAADQGRGPNQDPSPSHGPDPDLEVQPVKSPLVVVQTSCTISNTFCNILINMFLYIILNCILLQHYGKRS